jgi:hypothetical protein
MRGMAVSLFLLFLREIISGRNLLPAETLGFAVSANEKNSGKQRRYLLILAVFSN